MNASKLLKPHYKEILIFSFPILFSMVLQNIMGVVDNVLMGKLGIASLAASGIAVFVLFIHASPMIGLGNAVQSVIANLIGAGKRRNIAYTQNAAIVFSLIIGLSITFFSKHYVQQLLAYMTKDKIVHQLACDYLNIRIFGIFAIGISHSFRGFWSGIGRPKIYLGVMICSYFVDGILSYSLAFGVLGLPRMGITGIGFGSVAASLFASIVNLALAHFIESENYSFNKIFDKTIYINLLKHLIPSSGQQFFLALSYAVFFAIIGRLGVNELAAANILMIISLFFIYPGMALGMTSATYVGRSIGAGKYEEAMWWNKKIVKLTFIVFALISFPLMLYSDKILSIFTDSQAVIGLATLPLQIFFATLSIEVLGQVYTFAFFGAGKSSIVLVITIITQWFGILLFSYLLGKNLTQVWAIQIAFRCIQTLVLSYLWHSKNKLISVHRFFYNHF